MQVNILEAKNRLSELAGGGTILKPLIVAQIPHLTPQSTPHSSVIPAQAGNHSETFDRCTNPTSNAAIHTPPQRHPGAGREPF